MIPLPGKALFALLLSPIFLLSAPGYALGGEPTDLRNALESLQARDARVQSIGWKLITGNVAFCADTQPAIGLLLQDIAAFSRPQPIREELGLTGDIAVQAVAAGSPAEAAALPVNAEILAIDGRDLRDLPPPGKERWVRMAGLHEKIDQTLARSGQVALMWQAAQQAPQTTTIRGAAACRSRFEVITGSKKVSANGLRVAVGEDFIGFSYADELLAAALAHEVAHNLLGHPAWLATHGRGRRNIRVTEREADRLMPWLLANSGYDPVAAERFMRQWGPANDGGILRNRTHDGWDERADFIAAELPAIKQAMAQDGAAAWSAAFRRDIAP